MRKHKLLLLIIFAILDNASTMSIKDTIKADLMYQREFSKFVSKFSRNYKTSEEYLTRLKTFKRNLDYIEKFNSE